MDWKVNYLDHVHDKYYDNEENDRIVRCLITMKEEVNIQKITDTMHRLIQVVPWLNSVYIEYPKTYGMWRQISGFDKLVNKCLSENSFFSNFLYRVNETTDPQFKIFVYDNLLGFSCNNMMCDIFGLKDLICLFFDLYKNLSNLSYVSKYTPVQSRQIEDYLKQIPLKSRLFGMNYKKLNNSGFNTFNFKFSPIKGAEANKWITTDIIFNQEVEQLRSIAGKHNTTVPVIYLTAYIRTIANVNKMFTVPINVGKYCDGRLDVVSHYYCASNLYTILPIVTSIKPTDNFTETLARVSYINNMIVENKLTSKKISTIQEALSTSEFFQYADLNLIPAELTDLGDNKIFELYIIPACRNVPYFTMSSTTCNGNTYLGTCNYCNSSDLPKIRYFMDWFKYEIRTLIYQNSPDFYKNFDEEEARAEFFETPAIQPDLLPRQSKTKTTSVNKITNKISSSNKKTKKNTKKNNSSYTKKDRDGLISKYKKLTGNDLIEIDENYAKYKASGKNSFQKRKWQDIEKFIKYKNEKNK